MINVKIKKKYGTDDYVFKFIVFADQNEVYINIE